MFYLIFFCIFVFVFFFQCIFVHFSCFTWITSFYCFQPTLQHASYYNYKTNNNNSQLTAQPAFGCSFLLIDAYFWQLVRPFNRPSAQAFCTTLTSFGKKTQWSVAAQWISFIYFSSLYCTVLPARFALTTTKIIAGFSGC